MGHSPPKNVAVIQLRVASGMTQRLFAQRMGWSENTQVDIERGRKAVTPEELKRMEALADERQQEEVAA